MPDAAPDAAALRAILKSQYRAALAMLREAVELCPADAWNADRHLNPNWQVAYHVLYFAHLYMDRDAASFVPWEGHRAGVQYPDGIPGPPDPASTLPLVAEPYAKEEILAYAAFCEARVEAAVDAMDLAAADSGFPWYPVPRLEQQVIAIRHIQHHAAQLATRLRQEAGLGVDWVGHRRGAAAG